MQHDGTTVVPYQGGGTKSVVNWGSTSPLWMSLICWILRLQWGKFRYKGTSAKIVFLCLPELLQKQWKSIKASSPLPRMALKKTPPVPHLTLLCLLCEVHPAEIWQCHLSRKHLLCAMTWGRGWGGAQVWRLCSVKWLKPGNQVPKLLRGG